MLFNNANLVDESLASIVDEPAFCAANSIIPSSLPLEASPILPVILEYVVLAPPSSSPLNFICPI